MISEREMVHQLYLIPQMEWTMKRLLRCFMPLEKYGLERSTKSVTRRSNKWIKKDYKGALSSRGRSRMFQNLRNCPAVDAKTMGCFAMAQTIMMAGKTNPSVQIHVIHLPAFCSPWTKDVKMAAFMPLRIENLSVCVDRYCSAIYRGLLSVLCAAMGISVFLQMRIHVEVWSQGLDHEISKSVQPQRICIILSSPTTSFWCNNFRKICNLMGKNRSLELPFLDQNY